MSELFVQPLNSMRKNFWLEQVVPLVLTVVSFIVLWAVLHGEVLLLNHFSPSDPIVVQVLWTDVLVGLTIYLKTSIDFAIFIGHLMRTHPGWKNRIAIETGTALGNALGTFVILAIWNSFREIEWLMALMVLVASLVLFKLAEDGLEHAESEDSAGYPPLFKRAVHWCKAILSRVNGIFDPILSRLMPHATLNVTKSYNITGLLAFSASIPFILGLDDFAGYVPLFSVVHVYGFAVGVLLGHMLLNLCLFVSPNTTIRLVKQPIISFLGSLAFIGLAIWGMTEVWHILKHM
jgi:hypothetical protein